jgi:asparagine synthetase B (glutamine-hydrolysing)
MDEDQLAAILEEGLRLHLASDVPLAVFLSGGVDSSVMANLAQHAANSPIHTFTLAFEEQELNEGPIARRIAAAIGTEHHEVMLTEQHFVDNLEAALDSLDQPTFDGLNSYYMSHAIRSAGFTVALSGTGGDELFGGYASYRDLPVLQRWSRRTALVPGCLKVAAATLASRLLSPSGRTVPSQTRWAKLPEMVRRGDDLLALYQLALPSRFPARASRAGLCRGARRRVSVGHEEPHHRGDACPHAAVGDQRDGAAAFPRRATAARQRRCEHGGVPRAARAAGGSGAVRERRPAG